ncbi:helix-turn-helix domain-containing protein [Oceanidesulfovibrio marinus]|uniref:Helix-turn-helix transcriptional regulator n=1 Tax=Oceanidesulfovibrio marinus TaxID=370038 RepID=A0ABX6NKI8_9BACT|nr:helix-turn-helix transcriptional regulator [Oceanidesulfovibrio marinus]QJT10212.1 helix-turn-helix transcriptional regulator [Oceanidesulfovibrio marinus]
MSIFSEEAFAHRLRAIKEDQGLSLKDMAAKAGLRKPQTLRNYLEGRALPNVETVATMVLNIGVCSYWLLTGEGEMWAQEDAAHGAGTTPGAGAQAEGQQPQTDLGRELDDVRKEFERVAAPPEVVQQAMLETIKSRSAPQEENPAGDLADRSSGTGKDVRGPRRAKGLGS